MGKKLAVRIPATSVEVLHKSHRVASHAKQHSGGFSTCPEHRPKHHRHHREWSPERFINWAQSIGPYTVQVIQHVLHGRPHAEPGYRACLGLLHHARRYSQKRLEAACEKALTIHSPNYRSITSILKKGLDQWPKEDAASTESASLEHDNVRGSGYYH